MLPPDRGPVLIPYFNVTINVVDSEKIRPVLVSYFDISINGVDPRRFLKTTTRICLIIVHFGKYTRPIHK